MPRRKAPKPIKPDFSDAAKKKAGITLNDFETQMSATALLHAAEKHELEQRIERLEWSINQAKDALLDGRRGDASPAFACAPEPLGLSSRP